MEPEPEITADNATAGEQQGAVLAPTSAPIAHMCAPCASEELNAAAFALLRDERLPLVGRFPALNEHILTHHQRASAAMGAKLARLRADILAVTAADPTSKFVIFSHHDKARLISPTLHIKH